MSRKVVLLIMDSVGVGELPDAHYYGDEGSHTLKNIIASNNGLKINNLISLGLGNIQGIDIPYRTSQPTGCYGKAAELSAGKDTTTGHWEIAGIVMDTPFPVFPNGFPDEVIIPFKNSINRDILWNKPASGTEIIEKLGETHMNTGFPIVYTSADSVFQIAAHEDVIHPEELYEMCKKARLILKGKHAVGRVIARPFTGSAGNFIRTENRRDFSLEPVSTTILDLLVERGFEVAAVGKIQDIFANRGITRSVHTHNNDEGIKATLDYMMGDFTGLIFTNLVDFDMVYGHRNDVAGYARAIESLDEKIPDLINALGDDDVLIITADHGCDPTTQSTDHSREYIPILVSGPNVNKGVDIGVRETFSDIGATILELFNIQPVSGNSFKYMLKEG